jgi:hypothetical protein
MEECWFKDKHGEMGKDHLACLKCKRMNQKIMDKPDDPQLESFLDGYRLAIMEIALHAQIFTKEQIDLVQGLEIKFKCAIDRGVLLPLCLFHLNVTFRLLMLYTTYWRVTCEKSSPKIFHYFFFLLPNKT